MLYHHEHHNLMRACEHLLTKSQQLQNWQQSGEQTERRSTTARSELSARYSRRRQIMQTRDGKEKEYTCPPHTLLSSGFEKIAVHESGVLHGHTVFLS
jgi:hypothetical protein